MGNKEKNLLGKNANKSLRQLIKSDRKKRTDSSAGPDKKPNKLSDKTGRQKGMGSSGIGNKGFLHIFSGIRAKILLSFSIPVVLMAIFGVVSYNKSSDAIIANYEKSTTDTLNSIRDYLDFGLVSVSNKSFELLSSDNLMSYYDRYNNIESFDNSVSYRALTQEVTVAEQMNSFIDATHIFGFVEKPLSTAGTFPESLFNNFLESEDSKAFEDETVAEAWMGAHPFVDEQLGRSNASYILSIIRRMPKGNGFIIMDISKAQITKTLSKIDYGEGSILGFITSDGREALTNTDSKKVFGELPYYKESLAGADKEGYSYETFDGKAYLYLYSKVGNTGAMVCALVPESTIIRQARDIRSLSIIFVLFASVSALIIGTIIAGGIGNAISKLMRSISEAAKGDLTVKFDTRRKDEINILSNGLTNMVGSMRKLIGEVTDVGTKVSISADLLSNTSENILGATKDISLTINEIEKGVVQQASDAELCSGQMANLSERINEVYGSTNEIEQIATDTKSIVGEGIVIIDNLKDKTTATTDITQVVIHDIEALEVQSRSIGNFVGMINEIASQTNLLSLNASIEAARAGEAGRGFAVVADEIRKLADQSVKAADQIQDIVTDIQNKTKGTALSAKQAENIVQSQTEALHKTVEVFESIDRHVAKLANNLEVISIGIKGIETAKEDTMDAISNISAVSQQTAAASEEVSATADSQIGSVQELSESALELANDAKKLEEAIKLFRIG